MNCQAAQNKILALEDPRNVPESLRSHVAGCGACRAWTEQAGRLERLLERLPVPPAPANKKASFLGDLARQPALAEPAAPHRGSVRDFVRKNASLVGGLAAAVLVAGGWFLFRGGDPATVAAVPTPRDPFLAKVVQRDVALAKADTPGRKLEVLGDLADDLSTEARGLARIATAEELKDVARWFDRVVKDGVVKQAEKLPPHAMLPAERLERLEALAGKLDAAAAEVEKLSGEVTPEAKRTLDRIVDTARDGQKKLRVLARQGV